MDYKLEVVVVPVLDVDRAKRFYADTLGFNVDGDIQPGGDMRVVQLIPPGSACSITIGPRPNNAKPGSLKGLQLVVSDVQAARTELLGRGVDVSPVQHVGENVPGERGKNEKRVECRTEHLGGFVRRHLDFGHEAHYCLRVRGTNCAVELGAQGCKVSQGLMTDAGVAHAAANAPSQHGLGPVTTPTLPALTADEIGQRRVASRTHVERVGFQDVEHHLQRR
jgi:catechol 2,3-dioxygenase-like lactoylglutathione lyase family enzyme